MIRRNSIAAFCVTLLFSACIGMSADISIRRDGSGTVKFLYTVDSSFASFGALDSENAKPPFPVTKEDFRRTTRAVEGLSLKSFREKEKDGQVTYEAVVSFTSLESLVKLLGGDEGHAKLVTENGKTALRLLVCPGRTESTGLDQAAFDSLVTTVFDGFTLDISFTTPSKNAVRWLDKAGREIPAPFSQNGSGAKERETGFTAQMTSLLLHESAVFYEVSW